MNKNILLALLFITISCTVYSQAPAGFVVTSPNSNLTWIGASNKTIAWNTAGTSTAVPYVDILLSTDGGITYTEMLAEKVPNDGSETVLLPNTSGTQNRIKIQSNSDDAFFDSSDTDFTISIAGPTMGITYNGERVITICKGTGSQIEFAFKTFNGFNTNTWFAILDDPYYIDIYGPYPYQQFLNSDGTISITANVSEYIQPGIYPVTILAASGSITKTVTVYIEVPSNDLGYYYSVLSPANNSTNVATTVNFQWQINSGIPEYYIIEIATDADFNNIIDTATISQTSYISSELLDDTLYFWRVTSYSGQCSLTSPTRTFLTGLPDCPIYNSEDIPTEIASGNASTTTSAIVIPTAYSITNLLVSIDITHTAINELTIKLKHPSGQQIDLYQQNCEGQDINVTFSSEGEAIQCGNNPALTGLILPSVPLTTFNNMSPAGIWTLSVTDNSSGNGGILNSWSLGICTTNTPLETENYSFENLSISPNPNNGNFTLSFNSASDQDIKVSVYDMSGRQLLNKTYLNSGNFEQQISLENAASGVYLVNIQDGDNTLSKKIVIK